MDKQSDVGTAFELVGFVATGVAITVLWSWPVMLLAAGLFTLAAGIAIDRAGRSAG